MRLNVSAILSGDDELIVSEDQVRKYIRNAAAAADSQTNELLEFSDGPIGRDSWLQMLARSGVAEARTHRALNKVSTRLGLPRGAKPRLIEYLKLVQGKVVDKDQLGGVAGISEWARRVRELRVEDGWLISSAVSRDDLRPGEYRLESLEPDTALAQRWRKANGIRRQSGSGKARLLAYFLDNVLVPVAKDELRYVAKLQEHPRRIRELVEESWQIESNLDRPTLEPGQYVMLDPGQLPPRARKAIKLRFEILDRDGHKCLSCGARPGDGRRLQVHHTQPVAEGGDNAPGNLETLCDDCHAGRHATSATRMSDELLRPDRELPLG